jgi:hypothetical protein
LRPTACSIDDALVEPVEAMPLGVLEAAIAADRLEEPRGERRVDAFEEHLEDHAEARYQWGNRR